jgi:biotin-dependent carboxylase-like uncharacterized protein
MIEVVRAGLLDLVMDAGRTGHVHLGVPVGGAADRRALAAANRLVGNPDTAAGLELTLTGPVLAFPDGGVAALTGAPFAATRTSGAPVVWNETLTLARGEELVLGRAVSGCRCWLAVRGGLALPKVMGSVSTFLSGGFGGLAGRALRAGDRLPCGQAEGGLRMRRYWPEPFDPAAPLWVIAGPQAAQFDDATLAAFFAGTWRVDGASDRRGLRLTGARVAQGGGGEMSSQAVLPGVVQIPPDGQPLVLGWDGPVTGGYPVIASVISADLARLAQLKPGDSVRFATVGVEVARAWAQSALMLEDVS